MKIKFIKSILVLAVIFALSPRLIYSGMGIPPTMVTDCTKITTSENSINNAVIDSIIEDYYFSFEEDKLLRILDNPNVISNKRYTAFKLCEDINKSKYTDIAPFSNPRGVRILVKKLLPELGISPKTIKQALPTLSLNSTSILRFTHNSCHIFDDYSFSICAKTQDEVAIDERYERYKRKHGIKNGRTKTIEFSLIELEISDFEDYTLYEHIKFLDCGLVTWGECSSKNRPNRSGSFIFNDILVTLTQFKTLELEGIAFKINNEKLNL